MNYSFRKRMHREEMGIREKNAYGCRDERSKNFILGVACAYVLLSYRVKIHGVDIIRIFSDEDIHTMIDRCGRLIDFASYIIDEVGVYSNPFYVAYMNSESWEIKRRIFFDKFGRKCQKCGATRGIQLHHLNYDNLGDENEEDLQALCFACHDMEH